MRRRNRFKAQDEVEAAEAADRQRVLPLRSRTAKASQRLTVLSVAYPFAAVHPDAVGGAEQVLSRLDAALVDGGHRSLVVAAEGSRVAGELTAAPMPPAPLCEAAMRQARMRYARIIEATLARTPVDLVHMHGLDFHDYLPAEGPPVLATLHLPADHYPGRVVFPQRSRTWTVCVSASQQATFEPSPNLLPPIENGVPFPDRAPLAAKRNFALLLSRICPEKGIHIALDAAKLAGIPLLIGGQIFPFDGHWRYFQEEVAPRLDRLRRFLGPVGGARKQRLLASARCVLIPSQIAETSSLVAREAMAAGTPVVAWRVGALADTVDDGRTGFLVDDVASMASAMLRADTLSAEHCRAVAHRRFSLDRMIKAYFAAYRTIIARSLPAGLLHSHAQGGQDRASVR